MSKFCLNSDVCRVCKNVLPQFRKRCDVYSIWFISADITKEANEIAALYKKEEEEKEKQSKTDLLCLCATVKRCYYILHRLHSKTLSE